MIKVIKSGRMTRVMKSGRWSITRLIAEENNSPMYLWLEWRIWRYNGAFCDDCGKNFIYCTNLEHKDATVKSTYMICG